MCRTPAPSTASHGRSATGDEPPSDVPRHDSPPSRLSPTDSEPSQLSAVHSSPDGPVMTSQSPPSKNTWRGSSWSRSMSRSRQVVPLSVERKKWLCPSSRLGTPLGSQAKRMPEPAGPRARLVSRCAEKVWFMRDSAPKTGKPGSASVAPKGLTPVPSGVCGMRGSSSRNQGSGSAVGEGAAVSSKHPATVKARMARTAQRVMAGRRLVAFLGFEAASAGLRK